MTDEHGPRTAALDTCVALNFIHVDRLALLHALPGYLFVLPPEVLTEVTETAQREQLSRAIADGWLRVETITDPSDLADYAECRRMLGKGEAACLVLARRNNCMVACDEKGRFQREAVARLGPGRIINTAGLFVAAIRAGLITVEEADSAKAVLEQHRFRLKFASFRDIL